MNNNLDEDKTITYQRSDGTIVTDGNGSQTPSEDLQNIKQLEERGVRVYR